MHARVHGRGLDDRAARRDEPVEALALRELADRPGLGAPFTDFRDDREVPFDEGQVNVRRERQ